VTAAFVVAFDRDDEGGEFAVADDLPKLPFGFEHAGGGPSERHFVWVPETAIRAISDQSSAMCLRCGELLSGAGVLLSGSAPV